MQGSSLAALDEPRLRVRVEAALAEFIAGRAVQLEPVGPELEPAVEALTGAVLGGKRLRPAFCYWGWRGAGGHDDDRIVLAAASLELLHASALIHDDVMDHSDVRRGRPTAHRAFAAMYADRGAEVAERFGLGAAILLGDLCMSWADGMLRTCGLDEAALTRAFPRYDAMRTEVVAGQYLDLVAQVSGEVSLPLALRVVRYKSAKYTVERPLHLGGVLAGGSEDLMAAYTAYGVPLGEAFQLRDDILGVFGDPKTTGKPAGDDLREGKRTALVAKAYELCDPSGLAVLREGIGNKRLDEDGVARLREVIVDSGALKAVEVLVTELTEAAFAGLDSAPLADSKDGELAAAALRELAVAATQRSQ